MNIIHLLIIIKIFNISYDNKYKVPGTNYSFNHVFEIKDIGDDYFIRFDRDNAKLQVLIKNDEYLFDVDNYLIDKKKFFFCTYVNENIVIQDINNREQIQLISPLTRMNENFKVNKNILAIKILKKNNLEQSIGLFLVDKKISVLDKKYEPIKNINYKDYKYDHSINMYNYSYLYYYKENLIAAYQDSIKLYTQEGSKSVIHLGKTLAPHLAYMKNGLLNFIYYDSESHDMYFYELKDFKITNQIIILNDK